MAAEKRDWYDTPEYYDIIFDADTEGEAGFLHRVYSTHSIAQESRPPIVLEPACGTGRLMAALASSGCAVHGFDANQTMVEYAQRRLNGSSAPARLWQDRLESFRIPRPVQYDMAHCLVSTFKYLLTEDHAVSHLRLVSEALRPGGIYVLGIHLTDYQRPAKEHERWVAERNGIRVVCNTRTWPADHGKRQEKVRTRLRVTKEGSCREQETNWIFRTYDAKQVRQLLSVVPDFAHVASYDFTHNINQARELDDSYSDIVLILRRR